MDFFDDLYKKLTVAANQTAKETTRLSGLAKVKFNLMKEKSKLEDAYKVLGEVYYKQLKNGEVDEKATAAAYDKIEKTFVEIEKYQTEINLMSNVKICTSCGEKVDKDMVYCPKCGAKQEVPVEEEAAEETAETEVKAENKED